MSEMKKILLILFCAFIVTLTACGRSAAETTTTQSATTTISSQTTTSTSTTKTAAAASSSTQVKYDEEDLDTSLNVSGMTDIRLEGDRISVDGSGVMVNGVSATISAAGTYSISGTLDDGQVLVNALDEGVIRLILNGVDITSSSSAPIYVINAEKVVITLADGTTNTITDGNSYILADPASNEPSAAVFSNDDLTINGDGTLTVNANYNHGIQSKDDLKITGGNIKVNAINDALKGRNYVALKNGNITVVSGGDGIQSNNDEDAAKASSSSKAAQSISSRVPTVSRRKPILPSAAAILPSPAVEAVPTAARVPVGGVGANRLLP